MGFWKKIIGFGFVLILILVLSPGIGFSAPCRSCEELASMNFGPDVEITSYEMFEADVLPAHCLIIGMLLPEEDPFLVKLPLEWNGNFYQEGNSGLAGSLPSLDYGLAQDYAAAGASGGYNGTDPVNADGKFGYDPGDGTNDYAEQ